MQREYETLKGNAEALTSQAEALNRDNAELLTEVARLGQEAKAREKAGAALRVELEGVRRERNQLRERSKAAEEAESRMRQRRDLSERSRAAEEAESMLVRQRRELSERSERS